MKECSFFNRWEIGPQLLRNCLNFKRKHYPVAEHQTDLDVHMNPFLLSSDVFLNKLTSQSNGKTLLQPLPMGNIFILC